MEELDVIVLPDDSSEGYISECDLSKYYLYYLYIFIEWIVSFLWISGYPRYLIKCNVSFLRISEYPQELHDYKKITCLRLNVSR